MTRVLLFEEGDDGWAWTLFRHDPEFDLADYAARGEADSPAEALGRALGVDSIMDAQFTATEVLGAAAPWVVINHVAAEYDYTIDQLLGRDRDRGITLARHVAMYVVREATDMSYPSIAALFDGRDHTTVLSAVRHVDRLRLNADATATRIDNILERIHSNPQQGLATELPEG